MFSVSTHRHVVETLLTACPILRLTSYGREKKNVG